MSENLELWKKLAKSDPDQVKPFKRFGGFSGHSIDPVYVLHKMTSIFGPCGHGWKISKPDFTTVTSNDGLVSVHCTVMVSVKLPGEEEFGEPIPGVGGDHVIATRKSGKFVDDEAFKKAYTDAIGNALKMLGMAADIRLGKFDDQKYVDHLRDEKNEARQTAKANGNGDSKPKNGGYQKNFVKPVNGQPESDKSAPNADDGPPSHLDDGPPCGPDDSDGSMIVKLQHDVVVGVASLEEGWKEIAVCLRQNDVGWFEATTILGSNKEIIERMPPRGGDNLRAIVSSKRDDAHEHGSLLGGGHAG